MIEDHGEYYEALLEVEHHLRTHTRDSWAWCDLGMLNLIMRDFANSIPPFDNTIAIHSNHEVAWNNKGFALLCLERLDEALLCFERTIEINEKNGTAWNNKGYVIYQLGKFEDALALFQRAIHIRESDIGPNYTGFIPCELGGPLYEFEDVEWAPEFPLDHEFAWTNKGCALYQMGKFEDALAAFDEALRLDPKDLAAWINRGYPLFQMSKFDEAIVAFERALAEPYYNSLPVYKMAGSEFARGNVDKGMATLIKAIESNEQYKDSLSKQKYLRDVKYGLQEALQVLDRAIEIEPNRELFWRNKATILQHLNREEESAECVRKYKELGGWKF